jgi:hypothetical protein
VEEGKSAAVLVASVVGGLFTIFRSIENTSPHDVHFPRRPCIPSLPANIWLHLGQLKDIFTEVTDALTAAGSWEIRKIELQLWHLPLVPNKLASQVRTLEQLGHGIRITESDLDFDVVVSRSIFIRLPQPGHLHCFPKVLSGTRRRLEQTLH